MLRLTAAAAVLICTGALWAHPEIEGAITRLNAAIAAAPADASLYVERGELYARHEVWLMAEANYLRALELSPEHPRLARVRGELALATGHATDAKAFFDAVLRRDPNDAETLVLRARTWVALKAPAAAVADFNAALRLLATPPPELFLERAALLAPAAALRSLEEGIEKLGPAITLHLKALALEEALGRIDEALLRLDTLAAQSERKEAWLKRRGDLLVRAGRSTEARSAYSAALAAIAALPDWLRASPDITRLSTELDRLAHPSS